MNKETENAIDIVQEGRYNRYEELVQYATNFVENKPITFTADDIRTQHHKEGNITPCENRVWGSVMRKLKNDGLIRSLGFIASDSIVGHCHPITLWETVNS